MALIIFLIVNILGFLSVAAIASLSIYNNWIPELPPELFDQFRLYFLGGTLVVWIVSGCISVGYLLLKTKIRLLFLLLPIIVPIGYAFFILNLYSV